MPRPFPSTPFQSKPQSLASLGQARHGRRLPFGCVLILFVYAAFANPVAAYSPADMAVQPLHLKSGQQAAGTGDLQGDMGDGGGGEHTDGTWLEEAMGISLGELALGLAAAAVSIAAAARVNSGTQVHTGATAQWGVDEEQGAGGPAQTSDTERE